jgi:2-polyprenyl-3-methyl-5-hydroxy-6-metoxy-1,4-benzoquinol methylase
MNDMDADLRGTNKIDVNHPCWLCGSDAEAAPLHSIRFPDQGYPGEFRLLHCRNCGVIFNSPRLNETALAQLYEKNYYLFLERPADAVHRISSLHNVTIREVVERHGIEPGRALEIGSAKGYLLAILREQGWSVEGVELSQHASDFARTELGLSVFSGTVEEYATRDDHPTFDLVYSTDVIEHVPDPRTFVAALGNLVKPGGWLLLGTPNGDAEGITLNGALWGGFNPFHIWFFNRDCLSRLLERDGFEVVEAYTYGNLRPSRRQSSDHIRARIRRRIPGRLLKLIRDARYLIKDLQGGGRRSVKEIITAATRELNRERPFHETEDGADDKRKSCRGENLVVLARKAG